jgi:hypothetical protein
VIKATDTFNLYSVGADLGSQDLARSKNTKIREIKEFKTGHQPRNSLVKDENGDLLADSHNILNRWKNYFSQLLNVNNVCDVRQIEVHTAERLVHSPSPLENEILIEKLKKYKSPGNDQIWAELIQAGGEMLLSAIPKLINSVWNKEELPISGRSLLLYQFTKRVTKLIVIIIVGYHCYLHHRKFYRISFSQG